MTTIVHNHERGLLFDDGNYSNILKPGSYTFFSKKKSVIIMDLNKEFKITDYNLNIFLNDSELIKELDMVNVSDNELVLHYEDGNLVGLLTSGKYAFWNVLKKHKFVTIDKRIPLVSEDFDKNIFKNPIMNGYFQEYTIENYQCGLLLFDGVYQKKLTAGKYYFWIGPVTVKIIIVDMRQQQIDMTGQEIMTDEKVTLRLNFVCQYKIIDPFVTILEIKDYLDQIYILLQLTLREYVGTYTLDDLLKKKEEIGDFCLRKLKEKEKGFGVEFISAGVKDIILPGEIKDILNKVLLAQKEAQANVITRREEIASTRSLLNTAKLLEENQILYRLKEMEFLEKICNKIGSISLNGGENIITQLKDIILNGQK
ncbi:MAG TPA: slipin family protein [Spirochaetota bacterium]|nr:slipin family protein [Spirochaetota bacterium]